MSKKEKKKANPTDSVTIEQKDWDKFQEDLADAIDMALPIYRCQLRKCHRGKGTSAQKIADKTLRHVMDALTAFAVYDTFIFLGSAMDGFSKKENFELASFVLCEAMRRGGLLKRKQIADVIEARDKMQKVHPPVESAMIKTQSQSVLIHASGGSEKGH